MYTPISQVVIALNTAGVQRASFNLPIVISSHRAFEDRVRSYTDIEEVAQDFDTASATYKAVAKCFSNDVKPSQVKVGRRNSDVTLTIDNAVVESDIVSFDLLLGQDTLNVSITLGAGETADDVASAIALQINSDPTFGASITATANTNTVDLVSTDFYTVDNLSSNITSQSVGSETAADVLANITSEDNNWYVAFVTDKEQAFVEGMCDAIESLEKIFIFGKYEEAALSAYDEVTSTDLLSYPARNSYNRSKGVWANADDDFSECAYGCFNLPYEAGSVVWTNLRITGVEVSAKQVNGSAKALSTTELGYLNDRNNTYFELVGGVTVARNGKVGSGEYVDTIRGRDNLQNDLNADIQNLLINQTGTKIPYTDAGITRIRSVIQNRLKIYSLRGFINPNFEINTPPVASVPLADRQARIYRSGSFRAELTGGIESTVINGSLVISLEL